MKSGRICFHDLVRALRVLQALLGDTKLAVIRIRIGDPRFAWETLGPEACGLPGLPAGQDADARFDTDGPEGLHGQRKRAINAIDFHLDNPNACVNPAGHAANDTRAVEGATMVGLAALVITAVASEGRAKGTDYMKAVGAGLAVGGVAGAFLEKRPRRVWTFEEVFAAPVPGALHLVA